MIHAMRHDTYMAYEARWRALMRSGRAIVMAFFTPCHAAMPKVAYAHAELIFRRARRKCRRFRLPLSALHAASLSQQWLFAACFTDFRRDAAAVPSHIHNRRVCQPLIYFLWLKMAAMVMHALCGRRARILRRARCQSNTAECPGSIRLVSVGGAKPRAPPTMFHQWQSAAKCRFIVIRLRMQYMLDIRRLLRSCHDATAIRQGVS